MENYQTYSRKDLMSLSTISFKDVLGRPPVKLATRDPLKTSDIDGCRSRIPGYQYTNK